MKLMRPDLNPDLDLGGGLHMRALVTADAALVAEATSGESESSLWGPRPVGPYSLDEAQATLSDWDPAAGGQFSLGILQSQQSQPSQQLLGAIGLMPDGQGSIELAYWMRPEQRGQGITARAVRAATAWAHHGLAVARIWLEINPANEPSLRVAQRAGYTFEERIPRHCREWASEDAEHDSWHDCLIWVHLSDDDR
jgi:RimJ/RimL family protein N-acetyltransferase